MPSVPTYKLTIVANSAAGTWPSWQAKIATIKAFYAPVCTLDVTLIPTHLTPEFAPYGPTSGNGTIYAIDEGWYADNVLPYAEGADIAMFVVPPADHPGIVTLMGLEADYQPLQTTVFSDETSHTYIGTIDQGETAVVYAEHELAHAFYAMLAKTDNTHLYFYAGTPEKVLAEFDFNEQLLSWYQKVIPEMKAWLAALQARQAPSNP